LADEVFVTVDINSARQRAFDVALNHRVRSLPKAPARTLRLRERDDAINGDDGDKVAEPDHLTWRVVAALGMRTSGKTQRSDASDERESST
jgi:hypothetical protein